MHGRIFVRRITKVLDSTQLDSSSRKPSFQAGVAQLHDVEEDWQLREKQIFLRGGGERARSSIFYPPVSFRKAKTKY